MNEFLSRLRGTMLNIFGIGGPSGFNFKNSSGVAQIRNGADDDWATAESRAIRLHGTNATNYAALQAGPGMSNSVTWTLPLADGSSGQVLGTNGAGTLQWTNGGGGASDNIFELAFDEQTGTQDIFSPGNNDKIKQIRIVVDAAAAGGSPTIVIGVSGDTDRYVAAADVNLKESAIYIINMDEDVGTSPPAIQAEITGGGQTFSGTIYVERDLS